MTKTLGQVAYEAWRERNIVEYTDRTILPDAWGVVSQKTRDDMQAAAEAVVTEAATNSLHQSMQDVLKDGQRQQRERKVIEAAKAYVQQREERPLDPEHVRQALYFDLVETVEELEKGDE